MALTNINFYLITIFATIAVFVGLAGIGEVVMTDTTGRWSPDENSIDYYLELKGGNANNEFDTYANRSSATTQGRDILKNEDDKSVSDEGDFLSTLFIKQERAQQPVDYFMVIYNLPSTLIRGLGLDPSNFAWLVNILTYTVFISLMIMVWRDIIRT